MQQRAAINLGDLANVLHTLRPESVREQEIILQCLGLQIDPVKQDDQSQHSRGAWQRKQQKAKNQGLQPAPQAEHKPAMPPAPEKPPEPEGEPLPIQITSLGQVETDPVSIPQPVLNDESLFQDDAAVLIQPKRDNLFPDRKSRGLLTAATAQLTVGKTLDIPRLIQASIQRRPQKQLPVLPRFTNRNGCQLMLDFSDALMPWWDDMRGLITQCHSLLGEANCPVYEFDYDPQEAIRWTEAGELPWRSVTNKPVLLATDFGITRYSRQLLRPSFAVWRDFALHCHKQRVPVIALTPIERQRAPKLFNKLEKLMTVVQWHPQVKAADIKRLLRQQNGGLR